MLTQCPRVQAFPPITPTLSSIGQRATLLLPDNLSWVPTTYIKGGRPTAAQELNPSFPGCTGTCHLCACPRFGSRLWMSQSIPHSSATNAGGATFRVGPQQSHHPYI